jgi:hypothetical protein
MYLRIIFSLTCITLATLVISPCTIAETNQPWSLDKALATPDWLSLSGSHRTRYEMLDSQFRLGTNGSDQVLVMRTSVLAVAHGERFSIGAELMDSRAALDDTGTIIHTGMVNPADVLQAYVQWRAEDVLTPASSSDLRIGRITMDVGSRRFVARNRYRNTINSFTGVDWRWQDTSGHQLRAFYTLPVYRKPNTFAELRDNELEFDEQDTEVQFWGLHYAARLSWGDHGELFYFGLDEEDSAGRPTRNRQLTTLGFRLYRQPEPTRFDYQIESAIQFGENRASIVQNVADLDHIAHFQHIEVGYSYDHPWKPRVVAQYDYASGDDNPNDGDHERFNTLFGARRFDFGPTGIYGPFARANLHTPGLRLQLKPAAGVSGFIAYRGYWLASDRDVWFTGLLRDRSGETGSFIGHQVEARVRWNLRPNGIRLEAGVAHLFAGEFMEDAPNSNGQGDATYLYSQIALSF